MGVFGNLYTKNNNDDLLNEAAIAEMGFEDIDDELLQEGFLTDPKADAIIDKCKADIREAKSEIKSNKKDPKAQIKSYEKLKKVLQDTKAKVCKLDFGQGRVRVSVNNFTQYLNSDFMKTLLFGWLNQANNVAQDVAYLKAHEKEFSKKETGYQYKASFCRVIDKNIQSIDKKISLLK